MSKIVGKLRPLVEQIITIARPGVELFVKYGSVELRPPLPTEVPEIAKGLGRFLIGIKDLHKTTVKDAFVNTLVGVEISLWFFLGEIIGKRHVVGYKV